MTLRLEAAAIAHEVNVAHLATDPLDVADIITAPDAPALQPPVTSTTLTELYPTPVAALLQRAHNRLLTGGWCSGALVDEEGARCMLGAIRIEARGDRDLETDAAVVVLDVIRRSFGEDIDSVPSFNDAWAVGRIPIRMVGEAARLADASGL
nr:hypothetical protein [Streptomyces sp. 2231.1]